MVCHSVGVFRVCALFNSFAVSDDADPLSGTVDAEPDTQPDPKTESMPRVPSESVGPLMDSAEPQAGSRTHACSGSRRRASISIPISIYMVLFTPVSKVFRGNLEMYFRFWEKLKGNICMRFNA